MRADLIAFLLATGCAWPAALRPAEAVSDEKAAANLVDRMNIAQLSALETMMLMARRATTLHAYEYNPYERG